MMPWSSPQHPRPGNRPREESVEQLGVHRNPAEGAGGVHFSATATEVEGHFHDRRVVPASSAPSSQARPLLPGGADLSLSYWHAVERLTSSVYAVMSFFMVGASSWPDAYTCIAVYNTCSGRSALAQDFTCATAPVPV